MIERKKMPQPRLSWYQRYRHWLLKRSVEREGPHADVILYKTGEILEVVRINGLNWHLHDGQVVTAPDILDAGAGKWLYRIYC